MLCTTLQVRFMFGMVIHPYEWVHGHPIWMGTVKAAYQLWMIINGCKWGYPTFGHVYIYIIVQRIQMRKAAAQASGRLKAKIYIIITWGSGIISATDGNDFNHLWFFYWILHHQLLHTKFNISWYTIQWKWHYNMFI
jgi:hypothetical protein